MKTTLHTFLNYFRCGVVSQTWRWAATFQLVTCEATLFCFSTPISLPRVFTQLIFSTILLEINFIVFLTAPDAWQR